MIKRAQHGFTMVELVLSVGLIALLGSMAAISFPTLLASARLSRAAIQLTGAVREAQAQAIKENRPWRVVLDADGRGFSLEYASSAEGAYGQCDSTGWTLSRHEPFPDTIQIGEQARSCLPFGPTGRTAWPAVVVASSQTPYNGGYATLRLTDGYQLDSTNLPGPITVDSRVASWQNANPQITLSFQELRNLSSICIGTFDYPSTTIRYPGWIKVEGLTGAGSWTTIYNHAGPPPVAMSGRYRTCVNVPVNGSYRDLRITLTRSTTWVVVDEIDGTNPFVKLHSPYRSKLLVVSSVTGRVTVK